MSGLGTKAPATPGRPGGPFFPQRPTGEKKTLQPVIHTRYPRLRRPRVLPWLKWVRDKEKWRCESCRAEGLGSGIPKQGQLLRLGRATQQKAKKAALRPSLYCPARQGTSYPPPAGTQFPKGLWTAAQMAGVFTFRNAPAGAGKRPVQVPIWGAFNPSLRIGHWRADEEAAGTNGHRPPGRSWG
jgi:hypothetical protein